MGETELLEKIRAGGQEQVRELEAARDRELAAIAERREAELARLEQEFRERKDASRRLILDRARSRAELEGRKAILAARWRVIERVMEQAGEMLRADPEYPELLQELARRYAGPETVIRLSEADTARFGPGLKPRPGEPADISGGLLVISGRQVIDCSLDESLSGMKGELAGLVARELFRDEQSQRPGEKRAG